MAAPSPCTFHLASEVLRSCPVAHPQRPSALTGCILSLQVPWNPPHPTMGPPSFIVSFRVCGDRESSESSHATLLWMVISSSSFAISPFSMLHPSPSCLWSGSFLDHGPQHSYGYRGRDSRSNLFVLRSGEVVYFIACVVVLYRPGGGPGGPGGGGQRHYRGHTDCVRW